MDQVVRRLLAAILLSLGLATSAWGACAVDARGTAPSGAALDAITTLDFTGLTVGSGSSRGLVLQIAWSGDPGAVTVVNWDQLGTPQALAQIVTVTNATTAHVARLYGLVNPTAGNKTLRVTWTNAHDIVIDAVSFTGVDQTGGATTFPNSTSATGAGANPTNSVTSLSGNCAIDIVEDLSSVFSAPTQTQDFINNVQNGLNGGGSDSVSVNPSFGWTATANQWSWAGTSIKAAAGATPSPPTRTLLGVGV